MATVLSSSKLAAAAGGRRLMPNWAREPLLHFVLLGAVLFGIDHLRTAREDDPHTITVDAAVDAQARKVFKDARGREPNADELYALRRVWLDNEVLYREGIALGLDKGDNAIRERVIFKALSVVDAGLKQPKVDEHVLREWFEQHRAKYDEPARYDFQEAVLAGERSEEALRAFASSLNAGNPGDAQASLRVFHGRPHDNLVQTYGEAFAKSLERAPPGEWHVVPSKSGLRVMRLERMTPAKPASFDTLSGVVMQDWLDATMAEKRSEAVRALTQKYTVNVVSKPS